ncbi:alpha/beta-hydrolase [Daedalea quercina L-15889]|uniref:carboxypeptidase C n=1 Tax=Daedalea quercina L-15889 TaxID=1314783 RepID=A0A165RKS1_9APHY|nr:alpha/beta-hydrolase [Daedalea quercina L-15889]
MVLPLALAALLPIPLIYASPYYSAVQRVLFPQPSEYTSDLTSSHPSLVPDVAGLPNVATRLEVTSRANLTLDCALVDDQSTAGYAHFTNAAGVEDKHMFWWLFKARNGWEDAPVVLVHGGGPGSSGMFMPFSGAGHCRLAVDEEGKGTLVPAKYSWTEEVNVLAVDYPVGAGFSYGTQSSLRNSSERAAWDLDDFLQAFWAKYPELVKNKFLYQSASYGGVYVPNTVSVIYSRNLAAQADPSSTRLLKMPESIMIGNGMSDWALNWRYWIQGNCYDNPIFNRTGCDLAIGLINECLDASQLAYEEPSLANRVRADELCMSRIYDLVPAVGSTGRNPYHATQKCDFYDSFSCFPEMRWLNEVANSGAFRRVIGVSEDYEYVFSDRKHVFKPFHANGDIVQSAYKLLAPAIEAGLRVMVYNGNTDGVCTWRSGLAWMKLLKTKHRDAFNAAPDVDWPGIGWVRTVGVGAGDYAFVSIDDAGHFAEWDREEAYRDILLKWLRNEPFVSARGTRAETSVSSDRS